VVDSAACVKRRGSVRIRVLDYKPADRGVTTDCVETARNVRLSALLPVADLGKCVLEVAQVHISFDSMSTQSVVPRMSILPFMHDLGPSVRTRAQGASDASPKGLRGSVGGMEQAGPICSRAYAKDVMRARYRKCLLAACNKQAEPGMSPSSGVHEARLAEIEASKRLEAM
jgi:hypothetical protein